MSILPSFAGMKTKETETQEIPVEYGIDFETGQLTGRKVKGLEAVKVWVWLCLRTERFRYQLYSQDYGVELDQYIGKAATEELLNMRCRKRVEEALLINKHITGVKDFSAFMDKDRLNISFTVQTVFGEVKIEDVRG